MKRSSFSFVLSVLLIGVGIAAHAQPSNGGPQPVPTAVPIDGGASLLLAGGVAYGLRRMRRGKPVK
ncbi:MAG: PID-CTERM protein-sorting domain-containing protein [Janthinobacterium lividum]